GAGVFRAWLLAAAGRGRVAPGSGGGGCLDRGGGRPGGDRAAASAAGGSCWTRRRARMRRPSGSVPTIRPLLWWVCVRDEGKGEEGAQVGRDRPGGVRPGLGPVALRLWPLRRKRARRGGDGAAAGRRPDPDRPRVRPGAAWTCSTTSGTTTSPATCCTTRCCRRPTAACACACCWTT